MDRWLAERLVHVGAGVSVREHLTGNRAVRGEVDDVVVGLRSQESIPRELQVGEVRRDLDPTSLTIGPLFERRVENQVTDDGSEQGVSLGGFRLVELSLSRASSLSISAACRYALQ